MSQHLPPGFGLRESACDSKRSYKTFKEAKKMATLTNRLGESNNTAAEPYHCRHCSSFHVGRAPKRRETAKRSRARYSEISAENDE